MKIDITLSRSATIPLTNYRSIKPAVKLAVKDIEPDEYSDIYKKMSKVVDAMWATEFICVMDEMTTINDIGISNYYKSLFAAEKTIKKDISILLPGNSIREE